MIDPAIKCLILFCESDLAVDIALIFNSRAIITPNLVEMARPASEEPETATTQIDPTTPFRLMSLPIEVRRIVYIQLFAGAQLDVNQHGCYFYDGPESYRSGHLPPVLLATSTLRAEATPVFSAALTAVHWGERPTLGFARVPVHYLQHTKVAVIETSSTELVGRTELPHLEELRFHECQGPFKPQGPFGYLQFSDQDVVDMVLEIYNDSDLPQLVREAREQGTWVVPRVFVETEMFVHCVEDCGAHDLWTVRSYLYQNPPLLPLLGTHSRDFGMVRLT